MKTLFGTDGIRGLSYQHPMTIEVCRKLGFALVSFLGKECPRIAIGMDTRSSGNDFRNALEEGIFSAGGNVLFTGIIPTPGVAHITKKYADAGIMISASHNPPEHNGLKLFSGEGHKFSDYEEENIEKLMNIANSASVKSRNSSLSRISEDAEKCSEEYVEFAKRSINVKLDNISILLDCANGAAYEVAGKIFKELGASVEIIGNNPDGKNINCNCGAIHPENMQNAMREKRFDIGLALDGDGDRLIICDEKGQILDGDRILAICALDAKSRNCLAHNTVVATDMTNMGFDNLMNENGINVARTRVGDSYVSEEMRVNGYVLGGEQSGHIIFGNCGGAGDGIIAALQLLRIMKEKNSPISLLAGRMRPYPQVLINMPVREKKRLEALKAYETIKTAERSIPEGRLLVRYSGTEALLRIMAEGPDIKKIRQAAMQIAAAVKEEIGCG